MFKLVITNWEVRLSTHAAHARLSVTSLTKTIAFASDAYKGSLAIGLSVESISTVLQKGHTTVETFIVS